MSDAMSEVMSAAMSQTLSQTLPGAMSQTLPGVMSQTLPGVMSQTLPGVMSQTLSQTLPGAMSQTPDHYVLAFSSTHLAMAADKALGEVGISFTMIPTPKQISAGCGIALRLGAADISRARQTLDTCTPPVEMQVWAVSADGHYCIC